MKNTCDLLWQLKQFDLLSQLKESQLKELSSWIKDREYKKGELIYLPGEPSESVHFLKEGKVKLSYLGPEGKEFTVSILAKGEPFGEMSVVGEEDRSLKAEALADVVLCTVSKRDFLHFADQTPELSLKVAKKIGQHRREIQNSLADLLFKDVPTRLAGTLRKLASDYGEKNSKGVEIKPSFTHEEIAQLIGSTRETTTANLNKFESEGLIEKGRGSILIKDVNGLKTRASRN
ncbi:Crp/Fnr family transcriptional regulator [Candidatus Bipolaricaulota bacterium]|nr:Crp/Fnr family transcriptional regulator [Candidatus Bipolaricaulota bacterium]